MIGSAEQQRVFKFILVENMAALTKWSVLLLTATAIFRNLAVIALCKSTVCVVAFFESTHSKQWAEEESFEYYDDLC